MTPLLVVCLVAVAAAQSVGPVQTQYGPVVGAVENYYGGLIGANVFKGIPYAAPPVGNLRWAPTAAPQPWSAPLQATSFAPGCPQHCDLPPHTCPARTAEDCLYLNVWTPLAGSNLPVMVWFHGGHFEAGSGEAPPYDSATMANLTNVVVVTVNYRLGALGWLRTTQLTGNYGLMDQIASLKWVQSNIRNFGGDPTRVMIYGQSAGGTSVSALIASPAAKGLFSRVLVESNPLGLPCMEESEGNALGARFMKDLGCGSASDPLSCARSMDVESVLAAQHQSAAHLNIGDLLEILYMWTPAIGDLLPDQPLTLFQQGRVAAVPMVMGTVEEEGRLFVYDMLSTSFSKLEYEAVIYAKFKLHAPKILSLYPAVAGGDNRDILSELITDYLFACPTRSAVRAHTSRGLETYLYRWNHSLDSRGAWGPNYTMCEGHVCHAAELIFVFNSGYGIYDYTPEEQVLSNDAVTAWGTFANGHQPNANWQRYSPSTDLAYVWAAPNEYVVSGLRQQYCDMWDQVGWNF